MVRTCQTRCMPHQRAGKLLLIRTINCQSFGPTHNQEYLAYFEIWVRRHPDARADSATDAVIDNVRGLCSHPTEAAKTADWGGIVRPSMMASRTRKAAGFCVNARSSCRGNDSIHVDIIQSWRAPGHLPCAQLSITNS